MKDTERYKSIQYLLIKELRIEEFRNQKLIDFRP